VKEIEAKNFAKLTAFELSLSPSRPRFCAAITKDDASVPIEITTIIDSMNQPAIVMVS